MFNTFDKKNIPNIITCFRIIGSVSLIFITPFELPFYIVYSLCGFSDLLDGFLARSMKVTSQLGSKLDTVADFMFYAAMLYHLTPYLYIKLHNSIWWFVGGVVLLRIFSYSFVALKFKCLASLHTYLNKLTGLCIFFMPYFIRFTFFNWYAWAVCAVAYAAAIQEIIIHIRRALKEGKANKEKANV